MAQVVGVLLSMSVFTSKKGKTLRKLVVHSSADEKVYSAICPGEMVLKVGRAYGLTVPEEIGFVGEIVEVAGPASAPVAPGNGKATVAA